MKNERKSEEKKTKKEKKRKKRRVYTLSSHILFHFCYRERKAHCKRERFPHRYTSRTDFYVSCFTSRESRKVKSGVRGKHKRMQT